MKREILCKLCFIKERQTFNSDNPYPGEYLKFVLGQALNDYRCDGCGKDIEKGTGCGCFTIYTDERPYTHWEPNFVKNITILASSNSVKVP